jgi:uncharacterized protein
MHAVRHDEQKMLRSFLISDRAEFLALYGRRRVGKTYLIRNFFEKKGNVIFFDVAGIKDAPMQEQIVNFTTRLGEVFYNGANLAAEQNWNTTFKRLTEILQKQKLDQKLVLFFDEFPWMATKNSKLLQNLDYFWNQYWSKNKNIKLIICGSTASWIIDKIINNKAGLHNRITRQILLAPLNLAETKNFLHNVNVKLNHEQLLQIYLVTGGIPYYLIHIEPGLSANQIIEMLAFKRNAFLLNEFNNLYASLFAHHEDYIEVIRFIAKHPYGVSQHDIFSSIDKKLKGKKGLHILQSLQEAGFILKFKPYQHKKKGIYYRVIDEYTLFYLYWIEPVKNTLLTHDFDAGYWQIQQKQAAWRTWSGYAFENVCYKHVSQIKKSLKLTPVDIPNTWRYVPQKNSEERGAQIDLLFDRQDGCITLCEIKYYNKIFTINKRYAEDLRRKLEVFKQQTRTKKQLFMVMITTNGVTPNRYVEELITHVVTIDALF